MTWNETYKVEKIEQLPNALPKTRNPNEIRNLEFSPLLFFILLTYIKIKF